MRGALSALAFLVLLLVSVDASAKRHTQRHARLSIEIPAGWQVDKESADVNAVGVDGHLIVVLGAMEASTFESARPLLDGALAPLLKEIRWSGPSTPRTLAGLGAQELHGSAKLENHGVELEVDLIASGPRIGLLLLVQDVGSADAVAPAKARLIASLHREAP